ncbi:hypothetical protein CCR83_03970 [Rhodobacter veldkampii DSM 11550]|uniref:Antitoxin Xre/MbcA/ParS-like toxin-binding domain-containing protein n=1 Tax=Phaeovulum veldkampii DSM 11550 TaxID=1185920 RepID=A0A2T4JH38_9RHOB|nr:hypothetical protein [Phaeovulum veldkampii]MBK5945627.1 hypothetical protein [Phaeovulum veldkampii DSM 11550]PTE17235.1 hypothetical protein C5F46_10115 [Phaeovulum veldkampii DSM 11550]TDQ56243.1 hypothetical protein EV658_12014 [Phaeovulum veldkampii DSM 11550]
MSERNDITGLLAFIGREGDWRDRLQAVVAEHLMPALEEFEIDEDGLADLLGEQWSGVLWGCGFEDFLGQRYEDGNIVDLYLKRRGWKETVLNRAYFAALRDAPVSLYEVSDVQPGTSMVLRDLLSDAAPVMVREKSATRTLKQWDRIAVRVVPERDHHVISGALLPFRAEAVDFLFAGLRDALKLKKRDALRLSHDQLMGCAPIFTSAWLFIEIDRALTPEQPQFSNSDGDDVLFHDLRYPLTSGVTQKAVAERLDRVKDFQPEGAKFWNWLAARKERGGKAGGSIMLDTQMEGATVLGSVELKGKTLLVTVNSAERAAKVQTLISAAAGDLLRAPLTTIRTVEQMRADQQRDGPRKEADEIPPEIARQFMRDHLDKHYRETLDAPIPALGGKSPRQAVRTAAGRAKVIDWLKMLENRSAGHGEGPIAEYDFGWMWVELGLQEHRK